MSNQNLESSNAGNEIWPMGLDMDFGLDGSLSKNMNTHKNYARNASTSSYTDVPNTFFQRLDEFKDDILQITDLTNSLHKGDAESAQVVLNKMACQELGELVSSECLQSEPLVQNFSEHNSSTKNVYAPKDVYGKVSYYNGKLVLQLRVSQETSNHFFNISDCWLCQERINVNGQENCHRHSIHASFLSSSEYVQFDIDEFQPHHTSANMDFNNHPKAQFNPLNEEELLNSDARNFTDVTTSDSCHTKVNSVPIYSNEEHHLLNKPNIESSASQPLAPLVEIPEDSTKNSRTKEELHVHQVVNSCKGSFEPNGQNMQNYDIVKKNEVGAKKRKSRVQKKSTSHIQINESSSACPIFSKSEENHVVRKLNEVISQASDEPKTPILNQTNDKFPSKPRVKKKLAKLSCYICNEEFKSSNILAYKNHILCHGVSSLEMFSCSYCSQKFANLKPFCAHLRSHKAKDTTCVLCGIKYSRASRLRHHMDTFHFQKRKFQCEVCLKKFFRAEYLKKHMNIHNNIRFNCDRCDVTCSTKFNLSEHKKIHLTPTAVTCDTCGETFPRKTMLASHIAKEHVRSKLECVVCNKVFSRPDVLKRHQLIHDERQVKFACDQCHKQFSRKDKLFSHVKTHNLAPTNLCPYCPATFKKKDVFQKHLNIHKTKEQCNICYKFFPTSTRLQSHLRWHEKQIKLNFERKYLNNHECEKCLKSFSSTELLVRHMARVHNNDENKTSPPAEREKKFFCELCPKGFTRSCNLKSHMKTHRPTEDEEMMEAKSPCNSRINKVKKISSTPTFVERDTSGEMEAQPPRMLLDFDANKYNHFAYPPMLPTTEEASLPYSYPYGSTMADNHIPTTNMTSSPSSPINLSTEAITAAAYLLAYPSYPY